MRCAPPLTSLAAPRAPARRGGRAAALVAAVTLALAGCGERTDPAEARAPLPGVSSVEREWFWRDVLAEPLPGQPAADEALLALDDPAGRVAGLVALAGSGDPRAPVTLMRALKDPQPGVAVVAARLLGETGCDEAIPRLLAGIGPYPIDYDVPPEVRMAEASALARLGNPGGVPLLLMALAEGTDLEAGHLALEWPRTDQIALMQEQALPGLRALAGTDFGFRPYPAPAPQREEAVRRARAWWQRERVALWMAAPLRGERLAARVRLLVAHLDAYQLRQIDDARFVLARLGPGALPHLIDALRSRNDYLRLHALEIMERMADRADTKLRVRLAGAAAEPLLADPVSGVAAQAAAVVGAAGVADQLIVALERRREPDVRVAIVDALGRSGRPEALPPLLALEAATVAADPDEPGAPGARPPDLEAALQAALLALDPQRPPDAFLALLASDDPNLAFAALPRLVALTGSSHGLDPAAPSAERAAALARASTALEGRTD